MRPCAAVRTLHFLHFEHVEHVGSLLTMGRLRAIFMEGRLIGATDLWNDDSWQRRTVPCRILGEKNNSTRGMVSKSHDKVFPAVWSAELSLIIPPVALITHYLPYQPLAVETPDWLAHILFSHISVVGYQPFFYTFPRGWIVTELCQNCDSTIAILLWMRGCAPLLMHFVYFVCDWCTSHTCLVVFGPMVLWFNCLMQDGYVER